jgi:FkbH-like protein
MDSEATSAPLARATAALDKAACQPIVFAERPRYAELIGMTWNWPTTRLPIMVHRNQPFEFVARLLRAYLAFGDRQLDVAYSRYDDSLPMETDGSAEVELVWVDFDRYSAAGDGLASWFAERLSELRGRTEAPILVCDWPTRTSQADAFNAALFASAELLPGVYVCPLSEASKALGEAFLDPRGPSLSGSQLSRDAIAHAARLLGLRWIPAVIGPWIKAVVVDLDNTLYDGVLGEDSIHGIQIGDDHRRLQRNLVTLGEHGTFLAIASRNEPADVEALLAPGGMMDLKASHLSASSVGWHDKATGIAAIATQLRIAAGDMLFIDDNSGELAAVAATVGARTVHAREPAETLRALQWFPGIVRFGASVVDQLRTNDLRASAVRAAGIAAAPNSDAYMRSLEARLRFRMNPRDLVPRLHELSLKTNQFNTSLHRMTAAQVAAYLDHADRRVVSVELSDRLSDSGVVAAVFARHAETTLVIDEIDISCRALGRRLEPLLILEAIRGLLAQLPSSSVELEWRAGPRNRPALECLGALSGPLTGAHGSAIVDPAGTTAGGVLVEWIGEVRRE